MSEEKVKITKIDFSREYHEAWLYYELSNGQRGRVKCPLELAEFVFDAWKLYKDVEHLFTGKRV